MCEWKGTVRFPDERYYEQFNRKKRMAIPFNPDSVTSGFNLTKLNSNFDKTKTALSDALSRSGNGPNQMEADIDLNSNDLLNAKDIHATSLFVGGERVIPSSFVNTPVFFASSRNDIKALKTEKIQNAYFDGSLWLWTLGDFSSQLAIDVIGGVYLKSNYSASTVGAWRRADSINAKWYFSWFGVIGDDATDNSSAINQAISLASLQMPQVDLELPPGRVRHSQKIQLGRNKMVLSGSGRDSTTLVRTFANDHHILLRRSDLGNELNDVTVRNLSLEETVTANSSTAVICVDWAANINLENIVSTNGHTGVMLLGCFDINLQNVKQRFDYFDTSLIPSGRIGLYISVASIAAANGGARALSANIFINNSRFYTAFGGGGTAYGGDYGIKVDAVDGIWINNIYLGGFLVAAMHIENILAEASFPGYRCLGVQVANSWFDHNRGDGLLINGSGLLSAGVHNFSGVNFLGSNNNDYNVRIEGNAHDVKFNGCWMRLAKNDNIRITSTVSGFTVVGNTIGGARSAGTGGGVCVALVAGTDFIVSDNIIDGENTASAGIYLVGGTDFNVEGNTVRNCTTGILTDGTTNYYYISDSNNLHRNGTPFFDGSSGVNVKNPTPL